MAVFVPVADVGEFVVVQQLFGQNVLNVYHIKKEGGWTSASLATMCEALISAYNDHIASNQSTDIQYIIVRARDLTTAAGAVAEVNFPPLSGGDAGASSSPGNVAFCVSHKTGLAGRSFRGRTYLAGITETATQGNVLAPASVNNIVAAFDALDGVITAAGGTWGVVSRYSGYTQSPPKYKKIPTPRAAGIFTDIINNSADANLDSMKSRLTGRGQ